MTESAHLIRLHPADLPTHAGNIARLAEAAAQADGIAALDEAALLRLRSGGSDSGHPSCTEDTPSVAHVLADGPGGVAGYCQAVATDGVMEVALVVHPEHRRRGIGTQLLGAALKHDSAVDAVPPVQGWAHGNMPAAREFALSAGARAVRTLFKMSAPLDASGHAPEAPAGVVVRTLIPGADDAALLAVNGAAFAGHPEQGGWTTSDLAARYSSEWFAAADVFVAEREDAPGEFLGFHWTKRAVPDRGEVYVIAVGPNAQGMGLGKTLLNVGLHHLRDVGDSYVDLYVDADNEAAVNLYRRSGFSVSEEHVMYARGAS